MAKKPIPTPEELRQLLTYDPDTGKLFWKERGPQWFPQKSAREPSHSAAIWNSRYAGREAFSDKATNGYLFGGIFKTNIMAHRVAWAVHNGEWPNGEIDHINGVKTDNRICNLRLATRSQNNANRSPNAGRKLKGVHKNRHRWIACINYGGKAHHIGSFATPEEAGRAYDAAALQRFGEYAGLNFPDWIAATQDALAHLLEDDE